MFRLLTSFTERANAHVTPAQRLGLVPADQPAVPVTALTIEARSRLIAAKKKESAISTAQLSTRRTQAPAANLFSGAISGITGTARPRRTVAKTKAKGQPAILSRLGGRLGDVAVEVAGGAPAAKKARPSIFDRLGPR